MHFGSSQVELKQGRRVRPCCKVVVANNFAGVDPDISTRGTVGEWADVCLDGTRCPEFSCGTDRDGHLGRGVIENKHSTDVESTSRVRASV